MHHRLHHLSQSELQNIMSEASKPLPPEQAAYPDISLPPGRSLSATRRQFLSAMMLGGSALGLGGCAAGLSRSRPRAPAGQAVELLYYADLLDSHRPEVAAVAATRIGPADQLGQAPWATVQGVPRLARSFDPAWQALTDPHAATSTRLGGSALLAASLDERRAELSGADPLTLENGQCWNGGGLGYLSSGESGPAISRMLKADVRVSSDERELWPGTAAASYRRSSTRVLGTLGEKRNTTLGITAWQRFTRAGVQVAVVGVTNPHAGDEQRALDAWFEDVSRQVDEAASNAELTVVLADVGSGPALWLAQRLPRADLVLAARGQDLWPELVRVLRDDGGEATVCFPGSRGLGAFHIRCISHGDHWRFDGQLMVAERQQLSPRGQSLAEDFQGQLARLRAPYTEWLDLPLATAPQWLWRRDTCAGSWDALIDAALASQSSANQLRLSPGLRHDVRVAPGEPITRDHLLSLTGGHRADIFQHPMSGNGLHQLLERAADQLFGEPMLLDRSEDLPRLGGLEWQCRYSRDTGRRVNLKGSAPGSLLTWSLHPGTPKGEPLWQCLERYLRSRSDGWSLAEPERVQLDYVDGHPGWHPAARLS